MEITITGRHLEVSEQLKKRTETKVKKFRKYLSRIQVIDVLLTQEKYRYQVEILVKADHFTAEAQTENDDLQNALDDAVSKIERQLRRHKEKLIDKKHVKNPMKT